MFNSLKQNCQCNHLPCLFHYNLQSKQMYYRCLIAVICICCANVKAAGYTIQSVLHMRRLILIVCTKVTPAATRIYFGLTMLIILLIQLLGLTNHWILVDVKQSNLSKAMIDSASRCWDNRRWMSSSVEVFENGFHLLPVHKDYYYQEADLHFYMKMTLTKQRKYSSLFGSQSRCLQLRGNWLMFVQHRAVDLRHGLEPDLSHKNKDLPRILRSVRLDLDLKAKNMKVWSSDFVKLNNTAICRPCTDIQIKYSIY